jgi:hypothetical protein
MSDRIPKAGKKPKKSRDGSMTKPRELIEVMSQTSDPLGSYTGVPAGAPFEKPTQDADDL